MRNKTSKFFPSILAGLMLALPGLVSSATYTVSKDGRGAFTTIQAAVDKAGNGDIVEILDAAVYPEQVTLDSLRAGITLRSSNPRALQKPVIRWQDRANVSPKTCQEAKDPALAGQFETNGALRILRTRNITIEGIAVDGGGMFPFGASGIWSSQGVDCRWPLQHGNAGITIVVSGDVVIRNCKISNAFFGINIKDRNEGGIFANPNPADIEPHNVVPLSGFGKTGNHLFEQNRIHNNSFGMFFESVWDLGSVIRYNLFYNNHLPPARIAEITGLTSEGANLAGGAILFKDQLYSPLAIYNNTFWKNFLIFSGIWQTAGIHLVFNNIYAQPYAYWNSVTALQAGMNSAFDPVMPNRTYHCLYAAQIQPPAVQVTTVQANEYDQTTQQNLTVIDTIPNFQVRIMNGMGDIEPVDTTVTLTIPLSSGPVTRTQNATNIRRPGNRIVGTAGAQAAFPAAANVRWLETRFMSTDTASPNFLEPLWTDPEISKYVVDQGWPAAGIRDADGSLADLGAIPQGGIPEDNVTIRPIDPVNITGTTARARFDLRNLKGGIQNPSIKYYRFLKLPSQPDVWGPNSLKLPASTIMTPTPTTVANTGNTITSSIGAALGATDYYAFIEAIVEGTGAGGKPVTTSVGFLPYRKLDYLFEVKVYAVGNLTTPVTEVRVGETYVLEITPRQVGQNGIFPNPINPVTVDMVFGTTLYQAGTPLQPLTLPAGVTGITRTNVVFTRVPAQGIEYIRATGTYTQGTNRRAFAGTSDAIRILSGAPEKVMFQDPPSKILSPGSAPVIDPGIDRPVILHVLDAFGNRINQPATVNIKSNHPAIGDLVGVGGPGQTLTGTTDSAGVATFNVRVTEGDLNEVFELEASITGKTPDLADLKVGQPRDRLWILYADIAAYNPLAELRGTAGTRLPVTLRAGKTADVKIPGRTTEVRVEASAGLAVYASATAAAPADIFSLEAGEIVVWVTGLRVVDNGSLSVSPTTDNSILPANRERIFFSFSPYAVHGASVHSDNGFGRVDRLELRFSPNLKRAPDSITLSWPAPGLNTKVIRAGIVLDPASPNLISVTFPEPFPEGLTTFAGTNVLGSVHLFDPATPEIPPQALSVAVTDSVGPILDSATLQEKLEASDDTLFVAISEKVSAASLQGASLQLIKRDGGAPITLSVLAASDLESGRRFRIAVSDLGLQAPAEGDSLRINPAGPAVDAFGNRAHALNRPVPLGLKTVPKPAVLTVQLDKPFSGTRESSRGVDFVLLSPAPDSSLTPILGSTRDGRVVDCNQADCGVVVPPGVGLGGPSLTIETDRGFKFSISLFTNLGGFVNSFSGEITNAQLGVDDKGMPLPGAVPLFRRDARGRYQVRLAWNTRSHDGRLVGTGAYLAKVTLSSRAEDNAGKAYAVGAGRTMRLGVLR